MKTFLTLFFLILAIVFAGLAWKALVYDYNAVAGFVYSFLGGIFLLISDFFDKEGPQNDF